MVKKKSAIKSFIKEHKVLTLLFFISCVLLFLTSGIAFSIPDGIYSNIAKLIDVFTGAYVTGILLLLFVEEMPRERRRREAMKTVMPIIGKLHEEINDLTEMYRISSGGGNLNELWFNNRTVFVHKVRYNGTHIDNYYNLIDNSRVHAQNINRRIHNFTLTPLSQDCDDDLLTVISEIMVNGIIADLLPEGKAFGAIVGLPEANELLLHALDVIENLYPEIGRNEYTKMSPVEVEEFVDMIKKEKPEVDKVFKRAHDEAMRRDPI